MTVTTTHVNACDVAVWMDNNAGTLSDISGSTSAASIALSQNIGEARVFGSRYPLRRVCGQDCAIDLEIVYTTAASEAIDLVKNWWFTTPDTPRTVKVYIPDKNVGSDVYSGEFYPESIDIPVTAGEGEPIKVSINLVIDGILGHTTSAT